MNKRTVITILVIVVLLAIPTTLALASGELGDPDDNAYHVLAYTRISSATDPFTMQILDGVYQAKCDGDAIDLDLITVLDDDVLTPDSPELEKEYNLIVVSTDNRDEILPELCAERPDILFLTVDSSVPADQLPQNMINIVFRSEESSYAAGYAAGAVTKSGKVGILLGVEGSALLEKYAAAFEDGLKAGALEQGREVSSVRRYVGSFYDLPRGYELTEEMYNEGCDIVFMLAGSSGTGGIRCGLIENKYVIGVDYDQNDLAPNTVLFSMVKKINTAVKDTILACSRGEISGGREISLGYAEDAIGLEHFIDAMPEHVQKRARAIEEDIMYGVIMVRV